MFSWTLVYVLDTKESVVLGVPYLRGVYVGGIGGGVCVLVKRSLMRI